LVLVAERDLPEPRDRAAEPAPPPTPPRPGEEFKGAAASSVLSIDDSEFALGLGFGISGRPTPQNPHETSKPPPAFLLPWARQQKAPIFLGQLEPGASQPACPGSASACSHRPRF